MKRPFAKKYLSLIFILFVVGCSSIAIRNFDQLFGSQMVQQRLHSSETQAGEFYLDQVKPILEQRCVVCHACYDAPCQLKLSSPAGIDRGMHHDKVYNATRLTAAAPTRLYIDEKTTEAWRNRGFRPVLNERAQTAEANTQAGVMYQALQLRTQQPDYSQTLLDNELYDFSLDASRTCPSIEDYQRYAQDNPQNGMPYGMPKLANDELDTLNQWLETGAAMSDDISRHQALQSQVEHWENLLNGDDLKTRLMARYIYEHVYLFHLYFSEDSHLPPAFFRLIRSSTPSGEVANEITSLRPYDDPKIDTFYYRIIPELESISSKTHIPYRLDEEREQNWLRWFIEPEYTVDSLPSYDPVEAGNPFAAFQRLPLEGRYRFMLDDAEAYIMGFMKGPVCRGQVALNVIRDHFWVFFANPDKLDEDYINAFLVANKDHLRMPTTEANSTLLPISTWRRYAKRQHQYSESRAKFLAKAIEDGTRLDMDMIWDGAGSDDNVSLTILRHFDSASVVKGTVGQEPKTVWVMDYSLLERIHYLLVAGFDPYGNMGHQLVTRLYMDFLRLEGEINFISFLPPDDRFEVLKSWYPSANNEIIDYVKKHPYESHFPTAIAFNDRQPVKQQLVKLLQQRVAQATNQDYHISAADPLEIQRLAHSLSQWKGAQVKLLPQVVFIEYQAQGQTSRYYTLLRHNEHSNITSLFSEDSNRLPAEDYISLQAGLVGAYPSTFWQVNADNIAQLSSALIDLRSEADYQALMDQFGMRRTNKEFWAYSDRLHQYQQQHSPIEAGLMDYNRLQNR